MGSVDKIRRGLSRVLERTIQSGRLPRLTPMPTTKDKRLAQGERSRDEILDAASQLMARRGYEGTSVAEIARDSGLPNSSIYWHFQSKQGILAAVMERGADRFFDDVRPSPPEEGEEPEEHLRRSFERIGEVFRAHPDFLRLFVLLLLSNEDVGVGDIVSRVRERGRASLRAQVAESLSPWGAEVAMGVSERIADFALAGFDGAFLALQANSPTQHQTLLEQLAESLVALARLERDRLTTRP